MSVNCRSILSVTFTQKKPEVLFDIQKILGIGWVYKSSVHYRFGITNKKDITKFVHLILPYSIVKRKQLEYALKFLKLVGPSHVHTIKANHKKREVLSKIIRQEKITKF